MSQRPVAALGLLAVVAGLGACSSPYGTYDGVRDFAATFEASPTAAAAGFTCDLPDQEDRKRRTELAGYESAECFPADYRTGSGDHVKLIVAVNEEGDEWNRKYPLTDGMPPENVALKSIDEGWQIQGKAQITVPLRKDLGGELVRSVRQDK